MAKFYEYRNGKLVECYDLGEAECPKCGCQAVGYYKNGELAKTGLCIMCSRRSERRSSKYRKRVQ